MFDLNEMKTIRKTKKRKASIVGCAIKFSKEVRIYIDPSFIKERCKFLGVEELKKAILKIDDKSLVVIPTNGNESLWAINVAKNNKYYIASPMFYEIITESWGYTEDELREFKILKGNIEYSKDKTTRGVQFDKGDLK